MVSNKALQSDKPFAVRDIESPSLAEGCHSLLYYGVCLGSLTATWQ